MIAVRAFVSGRVQGVGFRYATMERARDLGLTGWVRNLPDGRVEAFVQGEPARVAALLAFLAEGPRWAAVERVDRHDAEPDPALDHFGLR